MKIFELIEELENYDPHCHVHYYDEIAESLKREQPIVQEVINNGNHVYLR